MEHLPAHDIATYSKMSARELRRAYVIEDLFKPGEVTLKLWETDRTVVGGAVPLRKALELVPPPGLKADHFNDRRELGVVNTGGAGRVAVDGRVFALGNLDCLYIGRGAKKVVFSSASQGTPAQFYLLSYPAHARYPNKLARHVPVEE